MSASEGFYVSVADGRRKALLVGPFAERQYAETWVEAVRTWVVGAKPEAHFYGFGVARIVAETLPAGSLNGRVPGAMGAAA